MVIDPETAPIVRRVFEEIIAGKSTSQVARELNAEGVPTPLEYKGVRRKNQSDKKTSLDASADSGNAEKHQVHRLYGQPHP